MIMSKGVLGALVAVLIMPFGLMAAGDDYLALMNTPGPDRYNDGSIVKDGECYALVWVKQGYAFEGFRVDGTLVNPATSDIVAVAPLARNGRCDTTLFAIDRAYVSSKSSAEWAGGEWKLYLLDTRRKDGTVMGLKNGVLARVRRWCDAKTSIGKPGERVTLSLMGATVGAAGVCANSPSSIEGVEAGKPVVTAIEVKDGKVNMLVGNTFSFVDYQAVPVLGTQQDGGKVFAGDEDGEVETSVKTSGNCALFKIKGEFANN